MEKRTVGRRKVVVEEGVCLGEIQRCGEDDEGGGDDNSNEDGLEGFRQS